MAEQERRKRYAVASKPVTKQVEIKFNYAKNKEQKYPKPITKRIDMSFLTKNKKK